MVKQGMSYFHFRKGDIGSSSTYCNMQLWNYLFTLFYWSRILSKVLYCKISRYGYIFFIKTNTGTFLQRSEKRNACWKLRRV